MRARNLILSITAVSFGLAAQAREANNIKILNNLNNQPVSTVNNQPVTNVEASPLSESRATQLRDARRGAEIQTEQKIVEKLEQDRLEAERERSERLFGHFGERPHQPVAPSTGPIHIEKNKTQPVVVQIVQAEKKEVNVGKKEVNVNKEVSIGAETEVIHHHKPYHKPYRKRFFVSGLIGSADYKAYNIDTNYAAGFSIGARTDRHFEVEGNFIYSNYYIDDSYWYDYYPNYKEMDQYNFGVSVKYLILPDSFRPYLGGMVSYTQRKYQGCYTYYYGTHYYGESGTACSGGGTATTEALDFGLLAGVDFDIGRNMSVGVDYKYVMNFANKKDPFENYWYQDGTPVEEIDYSMLGVTAKFKF